MKQEFNFALGFMLDDDELETDFSSSVNGKDLSLNLIVTIKVDIDRNYGADADGNRGICAVFSEVEDFRIVNVKGEVVELPEFIEKIFLKSIEDQLDGLAQEVIENARDEKEIEDERKFDEIRDEKLIKESEFNEKSNN